MDKKPEYSQYRKDFLNIRHQLHDPEMGDMNTQLFPKPHTGDPSVIGVFIPDDSAQFGSTKGRSRCVRFYLCYRCHRGQGTHATVEKIVRSEIAGGITNA
ncbi:MAG TPA: hypothetical protein PKZ42_10405 [Syntrophales bacterium]|nr:hypothetical protein [Syntrophales bacterium]